VAARVAAAVRDLKARLRTALAAADKKLEQTYTIAYIAHAPLEPRAAVAEWNGDKLTVWTGTQRPFGVRSELAEAFHISEDKVRVIVPDTGSGYGGKHTGEYAVEAARLAKAAGKTRQARWTTRRRIHLGIFPAGRGNRHQERREERRHHDGLGISQLQLGRVRNSNQVRDSEQRHSLSSSEFASAPGFVSRAWLPLRIISRANRISMNWRTN
jgi:CO/xanthine dehydrogenase Mo-binding subunit